MAKKTEEATAYQVFSPDEFLELANNLKTEFITPEELGAKKGVWIRELTGHERQVIVGMGGKIRIYEDGGREVDLASGNPDANIKLCLYSMVTDETGQEQMFRAGKQDADRLKKLPAHVLDTITRRVRALSGMDAESIEAAKKNSKTQKNDDGLN